VRPLRRVARPPPRTLGTEEAWGGGVSPNPLLPELEAEIDLRLAWLLEDLPAEDTDLVLRLMRVSYAVGYCDSLREDGGMLRDFGYQVPRATA
jgi:hypothetical protein